MTRDTHLLASETVGVAGKFVREFMLLLDVISVDAKAQEKDRAFIPVMYVTRLSSPF